MSVRNTSEPEDAAAAIVVKASPVCKSVKQVVETKCFVVKLLTCLKDGAENKHAAKPWFNRESRQNPTKRGQLVPLVIRFDLTEENLGFNHCVNGGRLHALGEELTNRAKAEKSVNLCK